MAGAAARRAKWLNISYRSLLYKLQESEVTVVSGKQRKTDLLLKPPRLFEDYRTLAEFMRGRRSMMLAST